MTTSKHVEPPPAGRRVEHLVRTAFNRAPFPDRGTWKPVRCGSDLGATIVCPGCARKSVIAAERIHGGQVVMVECGYRRLRYPNVPCAWFAHEILLYPWES